MQKHSTPKQNFPSSLTFCCSPGHIGSNIAVVRVTSHRLSSTPWISGWWGPSGDSHKTHIWDDGYLQEILPSYSMTRRSTPPYVLAMCHWKHKGIASFFSKFQIMSIGQWTSLATLEKLLFQECASLSTHCIYTRGDRRQAEARPGEPLWEMWKMSHTIAFLLSDPSREW